MKPTPVKVVSTPASRFIGRAVGVVTATFAVVVVFILSIGYWKWTATFAVLFLIVALCDDDVRRALSRKSKK